MFEGHASTFGNVDLGGDAVQPGAFVRSPRPEDGRIVPMLWDHDPSSRSASGHWRSPRTQEGLYVKGESLIESDPQARKISRADAAQGHRRAVDRLPRSARRRRARREAPGVNLLKVVDLREVRS